jgi:hypothetical protein
MLTNMKIHVKSDGPSEKDLKILLKNQINNLSLKSNEKEFLENINCIDQTLGLLDDEKDPFMFSMIGGYVKEFITSFLILYYGTQDLEKSLEANSLIKSLTKYIVLLDKHYDEKSYEYKVRADTIFKSIMKDAKGYVRYGIKHSMATLWNIASYEIKLKERMFSGEVFEKNEIRYHLMQKSSDTLLYSVILDKYVKKFNLNVLQLYHYNQALLDIQDDLNDVEEDIMNHDLNIFLMACGRELPLKDIINYRVSTDHVKRKSAEMILSIVTDFETCIDGITIPREFSFMKLLSRGYIKSLKDSLSSHI